MMVMTLDGVGRASAVTRAASDSLKFVHGALAAHVARVEDVALLEQHHVTLK
jgi:hypothetical protein